MYRANRYMRGLTDFELDCRFGDVMTNQVVLTDEGKLGLSQDYLEKGTHIMEELGLRGRGLPNPEGIKRRLQIPEPIHDDALIAMIKADYPKGVPKTFTLFKYGKKIYLDEFLKNGNLRLQPASAYDDPLLNPAVEDRELAFEKIEGMKRTLFKSETDYYCFCSSLLHQDRLLNDFGADCLVVITNPKEFFLRLASALDESEYDISFNKITYLDPVLMDGKKVTNLAYVKHMRFAYQFEHRLVAMPSSQILELPSRQLQLGPLNDIAKMYTF